MKRVLLKVSGEFLAGSKSFGIDNQITTELAKTVGNLCSENMQIGMVIGGGNFWRGRQNPDMNKVIADQIGMLATTMNGLLFADKLRELGFKAHVFNAYEIPAMTTRFRACDADAALNRGEVVIFSGGTGNPFFTTDSAAALRAAELGCDLMLKATLVDGIYDKDPHKYNDAVKYENLDYAEILEKNLKVIDATAAAICRDSKIDLVVFDISDMTNIGKILAGEKIGTYVKA